MRKDVQKIDENIFSCIFGFYRDCLKIIFKLRPDKNQNASDFVFEKIGAVLVVAVSIAMLVGAIIISEGS